VWVSRRLSPGQRPPTAVAHRSMRVGLIAGARLRHSEMPALGAPSTRRQALGPIVASEVGSSSDQTAGVNRLPGMSLSWIVVVSVIALGCVVAVTLFWSFWRSSEPGSAAWTDASWSVAAGLLGFEATFAAMFVAAGLHTVLWAIATSLALGMIPAYIAAVVVEASPAARRCQQRHHRDERPPLRHRVALTIVAQCAVLAVIAGEPVIVFESAAGLGVL
jgi:hypothetical protein